jgi:hypothetical protein
VAKNIRVMHCTVESLEDALNSIEGAWQPICWNFYPDGTVQKAVVVLSRIVQQMPLAAAPPNIRIRQ